MKKIAYILPGYSESHLHQRGYNKIVKFFEQNGIDAVNVEINWEKSSPKKFSDYAEQFLEIFKKPKGSRVYVLGFSFGAIIAFLTATKTKPEALILCSLSPYFVEDLERIKPTWVKWFRENFIESDYSFAKLARQIKCKTYIIVGDKEGEFCLFRARDAKHKLANSHLYVSEGAEHRISQKKYLETVKKAIAEL